MDSNKRITWALIGALYIMAFAVFFNETINKRYPAYDPNGHNEPHYYDEIELSLSELDLGAQWVVAFATILVFIWSVLSLQYANKTANAALNESRQNIAETKRSVDAFVETERSRLHVRGVRVIDQFEPTTFAITRELHFVIENVGRGLGVIRGEWTNVTYLTNQTPIPEIIRSQRLDPAYQPVIPGQPVTMTTEVGVERRLPVEMPPRPDWATSFAFRILVRYETQFREARIYGATFVGRMATGTIARVFTQDHCFDEPVTDGSAHPGQFGPEQQAEG